MSMTYLSTASLEYFPSMQDLYNQSKGEDVANWGLCQNNQNELEFRKPNEEWFLHGSIIEFTLAIIERHGTEYDPEDIIVYFEFTDGRRDELCGLRPLYTDFISLEHYVGAAQEAFIPYMATWLDS